MKEFSCFSLNSKLREWARNPAARLLNLITQTEEPLVKDQWKLYQGETVPGNVCSKYNLKEELRNVVFKSEWVTDFFAFHNGRIQWKGSNASVERTMSDSKILRNQKKPNCLLKP